MSFLLLDQVNSDLSPFGVDDLVFDCGSMYEPVFFSQWCTD